MKQIDVADLDCIYLSYQEPEKEEFWVKIKNMVPWAKRVDGVEGSDAAHKACAELSDTDRFVIIDGDNMPDADFFNQTLELDTQSESAVFRWRARNHINGLMYGNGGLSCWTKDFVKNMRTHENTNGNTETQVEFCFDPQYWPMHDCYSTTYPNQTDKQAWIAGFREGVKMCLDRGAKPTRSNFKRAVHARNMDNLQIWHNIGMDVDNGGYAMIGARMGTYMTMCTDWDYTDVQSFAVLDELWTKGQWQSIKLNEELEAKLDMKPVSFNAEQSAFFKRHYRSNWKNLGIMVRE